MDNVNLKFHLISKIVMLCLRKCHQEYRPLNRNYKRKKTINIMLAPVVQRPNNAIHRINHYPADSVVCFVNTYPLDSDLSSG